jgi:hypothetical protein
MERALFDCLQHFVPQWENRLTLDPEDDAEVVIARMIRTLKERPACVRTQRIREHIPRYLGLHPDAFWNTLRITRYHRRRPIHQWLLQCHLSEPMQFYLQLCPGWWELATGVVLAQVLDQFATFHTRSVAEITKRLQPLLKETPRDQRFQQLANLIYVLFHGSSSTTCLPAHTPVVVDCLPSSDDDSLHSADNDELAAMERVERLAHSSTALAHLMRTASAEIRATILVPICKHATEFLLRVQNHTVSLPVLVRRLYKWMRHPLPALAPKTLQLWVVGLFLCLKYPFVPKNNLHQKLIHHFRWTADTPPLDELIPRLHSLLP